MTTIRTLPYALLASFPGLCTLSLAVQKAGGKAWKDSSRDACH